MIVTLKEIPVFKEILKRALPSYRKHKIILRIAESVSLSGGYWDGGSRNEYFGLSAMGELRHLSYPTDPPQFGGGNPPDATTGEGMAILCGGTFCGKTSTLSVTIHPRDIDLFSLRSVLGGTST